MLNLKIDYIKIKDLISLREEYWENDYTTNCYAFSLGLDVPEEKIMKSAYQLGIIGATVKQIPINILKKLTFEERLILDLEVLGIKHQDSIVDETSGCRIYKNYIAMWWIISLFSNGKNFCKCQ